ncbi:conserved hypothetical protein [Ixodes scapularis]|uniref:Polyamine-modulated factor 1 n=1 Tax=Ixodes scapularis TaxID=6945 RepID=B7Q1P8_IXOSC|nr:conserved hypothetical protein [Ixodes scapularis]|eukprot:XP_002409977.1 conserved hypothetical protein [Ixodes scapularis]
MELSCPRLPQPSFLNCSRTLSEAMCAAERNLGEKFLTSIQKVFARGTDAFRRSSSSFSKYGPGMDVLFGEVTKGLESNVDKEFKLVLQEYGLLEKFALLSRLEAEQEQYKRTRAWRPSGNPAEDAEAHWEENSEEHANRLKALLRELEAENRRLEEQVMLGRKQCHDINAEAEIAAMEIDKECWRQTKDED